MIENQDRGPTDECGRVRQGEPEFEGRPIELRLEVVEYPHRADRATISPPNLSSFDRMVTWLSADRDSLVDLGEWR